MKTRFYLGSGDEVNLSLVVRVKGGVEGLGDVLGDGVGEALGGGLLEALHDLGAVCLTRRVVADENGILALYPLGLD